MRLPRPLGSQLPGLRVARDRDEGAAVGLAHGGAAVEGVPLGGVGDQPALHVEDGKAPPCRVESSSISKA